MEDSFCSALATKALHRFGQRKCSAELKMEFQSVKCGGHIHCFSGELSRRDDHHHYRRMLLAFTNIDAGIDYQPESQFPNQL